MGTGDNTIASESMLPVLGSSSKFLVAFQLGHLIEKDYQILDKISNKDVINGTKPWERIFTFRKLKQNLQEMHINILLYH